MSVVEASSISENANSDNQAMRAMGGKIDVVNRSLKRRLRDFVKYSTSGTSGNSLPCSTCITVADAEYLSILKE